MRKIVSLLTMVLLFTTVVSLAQGTITGQIRDGNGQPVPFASVKIKGNNSGVSADQNGNYTITGERNKTLVISAAGFQEQEVNAGNAAVISLKNASSLQEVVVTALGIRRQAREVGYSTATISGADLNQAKVVNAVTGLTGKVSGLQIQLSDNSVNPLVRVTLRGNRSILGNNQALVIVDGIQVDNSFLARINPNDIESFNVLKGASAAAIYGSNASNGVLVVNTRRGSRGKPRIGFNSTAQLETVSYLPKLQNRFGSYGGESLDQLLGVQFPEDPFKIYFPYENQSFGPEYNGKMVPLGGPVRIYRQDGSFYDSTQMVPYSAVTNGKNKFFDKGLTLQNNVSFSSGDENSTVFFSFQNVKVKGVVPSDESNRNTLRINGSKKYGIFSIDYNTTYTLGNVDQTGGSYFQDRPVYWTVINAPQHANLRNYKNWKTDPFANPNGYFNAYYGNPWWQVDQSRIKYRTNELIGSVKLGLNLTSWLNASYTLGYSRSDIDYKLTKAGFKFTDFAITDPWEAGAIPSSLKLLQPSLFDLAGYKDRVSGDALITADRDFGNFSTKLIVGSSFYKRRSRGITSITNSLVIPDLYNISNRQGEATVGEGIVQEGLLGVFGDLTLGYKNFLFLHGTGRNDWNSKLARENRSFFYSSADVSLVFTDLIPFFKNSGLLNYGKLRGALSKVGQVSVDPYSLDNVAFSGGGFPYGSTAGYTISNNYANPGLKPEFTAEKEVGIELSFLDSKINFQAAYYTTKTTNQTIPSQISSATGYTSATINLGSMTNKGVEFDLRLTPLLKLGDFKWNMAGNFTYIKNRIGQDLGGEISLGNSVFAIPGMAYPYLKEQDWKKDPAGRVIVDKNTGFPSKDPVFKPLGTTVPPYKLGLTTSFSYKGFTLNAVADARFGAVIFNDIGQDLDFTGISWYSAQTGRQPFIIPNSVTDDGGGKYTPNTNVATIDGNWRFWANTWNQTGAPYVNSADFWKIREISISYDFPQHLLNRLKVVQALSLTLSGRNLFMFRAKDNIWTDPEFSVAENGLNPTVSQNLNSVGLTNISQTPPTRIFGATLNVNF